MEQGAKALSKCARTSLGASVPMQALQRRRHLASDCLCFDGGTEEHQLLLLCRRRSSCRWLRLGAWAVGIATWACSGMSCRCWRACRKHDVSNAALKRCHRARAALGSHVSVFQGYSTA